MSADQTTAEVLARIADSDHNNEAETMGAALLEACREHGVPVEYGPCHICRNTTCDGGCADRAYDHIRGK